MSFSDAFDLLDPDKFNCLIDCSGIDRSVLISYLKSMKKIRSTEFMLARRREEGLIGGPVHLGVGQEAVAVGVSSVLNSSDMVFGAHRSHSHLLALGGDVRKLFAETLGKETGHSKGMGGSMHLWDGSVGFIGSVPIVAGTVPLALGAGLASKLKMDRTIAVAYLGDGAVEEGVVHESFNFASTHKIPILFVIENNLFASHMDLKDRQSGFFTSRFAEANNIPYKVVDGNDVLAVSEVSRAAANLIRSGVGPFFIEAITYRWLGHVDWRDDIDVGVNRSSYDLMKWKKRDPISRLRNGMINLQMWSGDEDLELDKAISIEIENAWNEASLDPYPEPQALFTRVYA